MREEEESGKGKYLAFWFNKLKVQALTFSCRKPILSTVNMELERLNQSLIRKGESNERCY